MQTQTQTIYTQPQPQTQMQMQMQTQMLYTRNYLFSLLIDRVTLHSLMNPRQPDVII